MATITLDEGAASATPGTGKVSVYAKTDGKVYSKDDAGAESALGFDAASPGEIGGTTPGIINGTTGNFTGAVSIASTLTAGLPTVEQAATDTLTAQECRGQRITNYGQSAENTQTLPAAAAGLGGMVQIETAGAGAFHLKAGAGDKHYFDSGDGTATALTDGDKVSIATPAVGDTLIFNAIRTGASAWDWLTVCVRGTATDGGA